MIHSSNIAEQLNIEARRDRVCWRRSGCVDRRLSAHRSMGQARTSVNCRARPARRTLALLGALGFQRQAETQGHALDRIGRATEKLRRLFQRSRRLGQLHQPAVFLERPGPARHNRIHPLVDTKTKPPSGPTFARRLCLGGAGLGAARCWRWICEPSAFATNNAD